MLITLGWFAAGLVALIGGAELLVRSGSTLASCLGIPPLIIGLTIVAIGTSAPELAVGIEAAMKGNGSLAIGNIAGTNIVNILLILGLSAIIEPLRLELRVLRFELPAMVASAVVLLTMSWDGVLTRTEGAILLGLAVVYTGIIIHSIRCKSFEAEGELHRRYPPPHDQHPAQVVGRDVAALAVSIVIIVIGADWLVDASIVLARMMQVSDAVIGLTIVAIGTSSPEFVTTIVSTIRRQRDIAIGNLLGSSVYNILAILGATCLFSPAGVDVEPALLYFDIPIMAAVALVCVPIFISGRCISRLEGSIFLSVYGVYLGYLVFART